MQPVTLNNLSPEYFNLDIFLETIPEGIIIQNIDGKVLKYNGEALAILGIEASELQETHLFHFEENQSLQKEKIFPYKNHPGMNSFFKGESQKDMNLFIFRGDGQSRWISLSTVPIFSSSTKKPHLILCTFRDVTDSIKKINELKQTKLIFDNSKDIMFFTNTEGYFKKTNPQIEKSLGYKSSELNSKKFFDFVHPEDIKKTEAEFLKFSKGELSAHFICRYKSKFEKYRLLDWIITFDKEINLFFYMARDITDYHLEELDLIHSSKVFSIGEMTSGIAFLLSSELSLISTHIAFLQTLSEHKEFNQETYINRFKIIENSIQKLNNTARELSTFAKKGEVEPMAIIPIFQIIDKVLTLSKERFRVHGVKIETLLNAKSSVKCRESQIIHAIINLLNNAYTIVHDFRDCWVRIETKENKDFVIIEISDSQNIKEIQNAALFKTVGILMKENLGHALFDCSGESAKYIVEIPKYHEELIS